MQTTIQEEKQKLRFDGVLSAGLILAIVCCSIIIAILSFFVIQDIWAAYVVSKTTYYEFRGVFGKSVLINIIVLIAFIIGAIITLVSTTKFLKGKSNSKATVGVLNLIFGGLIRGILILIGSYEQKKSSNAMSQMAQNDREYQEYLRNKRQDKNNR